MSDNNQTTETARNWGLSDSAKNTQTPQQPNESWEHFQQRENWRIWGNKQKEGK
jgi:hypothetical protein